ncbi:MAG: hypothetical protein GXO43_06695 [Crenarchaeota archaeon]|nr:hypothetical protein [Thermoproteota archaeon]
MPRGWLLDAIPLHGGGLDLVMKTGDRIIHHRVDPGFRGYIKPWVPAESLARDLMSSRYVRKAWVEEWLEPPYYRRGADIVVFETSDYYVLKKMLSQAPRLGAGEPVNTVPDPLIETLWRLGAKPSSLIDLEDRRARIIDDESNSPFTWAEIIEVYGEIEVPGLEFASHVIIRGDWGEDRVAVEELPVYLSGKHYDVLIASQSTLASLVSRGYDPSRISWVRIDRSTAFTGIHGLIMWSRLSYTPLRMLSGASIGKVLTTIEALEARRKKYLAVPGHGRVEPWRPLRELLRYDRGGAVYSPRPGLYWGICQIDFNSLYPSIIAKYNISGETVDDPSCHDAVRLPGTGHRICFERRGIVSQVLERLVNLREELKNKLMETSDPFMKAVLDEKQSSIKWILVASFGYLGYRKSMFGSIMAHETVASLDRYIIDTARRVVEERDCSVIHVLVDSLFIKHPEEITCEELRDLIVGATGFKAKVEADYKWLYIPATKKGLGAANRYYGALRSGGVKIKGVMAARKDTPPIVREAQEEAIKTLSRADDPETFKELLREAHGVIDEYSEKIRRGDVEPWKLVIRRRISKPSRKPSTQSGSLAMLMVGQALEAAYIVGPGRRLIPTREYSGSYDREYYLELLENARRELPVPGEARLF